jgi:hypothetical protein
MAPVTDPDLKDSRQQRAGRPAGELAQMALSDCWLSLLLNDLLLTAGSLFAYMREQTAACLADHHRRREHREQ